MDLLSPALLKKYKAARDLATPEFRRRSRRLELERSLSKFFRAAWPHFDPAPYTHGWQARRPRGAGA